MDKFMRRMHTLLFSPAHAIARRVTRVDAASDFFGESNVPRRAITMGVGRPASSCSR